MADLLSRVTAHGVLKVPFVFWVIVVFQMRHWLMVIAAAAGMRRSPDTARLLGSEGVPFVQLAIEVPVLLLAYAAFSRGPLGGAFERWVWHRGREIITLTAVLHSALSAWHLIGLERWKPLPDNIVLLGILLELGIVLGVWTSAHLKQVFAEFPKPAAPKK